MHCRISDLRYKEVINTYDGLRLGYVYDVVLNTLNGQIISIAIPGQAKFFGLFGRQDDYIIPWDCIRRIGDDIILVEIEGEYRREKYRKKQWQ